jgi:hypothetical protein
VLTTEARAGGVPTLDDVMSAGAEHYVLLQARLARDVADGCAEHSNYLLFRAVPQHPAALVFSGETRNCAYEEWAFLLREDGAIMVQSDQGRHRLLRWNAARGRIDALPWSP